MALQDLTPQLRTRLSRMERAVGWFVALAMLLLCFGFVYYVYKTAERKGWFKTKAAYFTFSQSATGLKVGDPVQLMGFDVGEITVIEGQQPYDPYNVYVEFVIKEPYYGYLWSEGSVAKINAADFLGKRVLEVTKGTGGYPTFVFHPRREVTLDEARALAAEKTPKGKPRWLFGQVVHDAAGTNILASPLKPLDALPAMRGATNAMLVVLDGSETRKTMTGVWSGNAGRYEPFTRATKPYWLQTVEAPAVTERLQGLLGEIEKALPNILSLTNQLARVLNDGSSLASNLNATVLTARPAVSNLAAATARLDQPGGLGEWLLPTNLNRQLDSTLGSAQTTLNTVNTNLSSLVENLNRSLDNLAGMTSNLTRQVEANPEMLRGISDTVIHTDQLIQGLKRHWLLRSAFKEKATNTPPADVPSRPLRAPKEQP